MADIDRMLCLVEKVLPLGKDEWERLAASFNASKPRGAPEREFESLRRKFKQLYSTRKPTGVATMPPHIQRAKEAKQAIDDKANVVELDDDADEDQPIAPDFSFEPEPDHTFYEPDDAEFVHAAAERSGAGSVHSEATGTDMSVDGGPQNRSVVRFRTCCLRHWCQKDSMPVV
ncbi:UDP-sugar-dependent glycosyltransferase 52 [Phytophthora nicotianae]|uniref:UDP-sugar-dependent glycosyltransferase 52 n=1 Tax=Phytophthora nicotianae TaxID=4792 RepID=A0A0W8CX43_PHYNI|nr:UDP-sugar-dependent glycosyltransferase 52 [Phytophthora nicotianae]